MCQYFVIIEILYMNFVLCNEREREAEMSEHIVCAKFYVHTYFRHNERESASNILSVLTLRTWILYFILRKLERNRHKYIFSFVSFNKCLLPNVGKECHKILSVIKFCTWNLHVITKKRGREIFEHIYL